MHQFDLTNSSFTLQWWIEGALVAEIKSPESSDGFAYTCEVCDHRVWAVKYFPNRAVTSIYANCPTHTEDLRPNEVPGSLILWWHDELERMPAVLVEREYALHLAHYDLGERYERDTLQQAA